MVSSLQVPVWLMEAAARHTCTIECINARGSSVTGQVHYHDISRLLIHNLTYKARTPSTLTRQTQRSPGLPSMTIVFHNTNKPEDVSSRPSLWLSGEACLNGSHCWRVCHPLFCLRFWRETKDDELMGLNILLPATGIGPCNENKHNKMYDMAFQPKWKTILAMSVEWLVYIIIGCTFLKFSLLWPMQNCMEHCRNTSIQEQNFYRPRFSLLLWNPTLPSSLVES